MRYSYFVYERNVYVNRNGRYYVYDLNSTDVYFISEAEYLAKEQVKQTTSKKSYLEEDIEKNRKKNKADKDIIQFGNNGKLAGIILMIDDNCNLNCVYCYRRDHLMPRMDFDTAKRSIDFLFEHTELDKLSVLFFGGEPLINLKLIKQTVNYIKEKQKTIEKEVSYAITTNGLLLSSDTADYLMKNHFSITVSIDGNEEQHNSNRPTLNGKNSYAKIIDNMKYLKDYNTVKIRSTITANNVDITAQCIDFEKKGIEKYFFSLGEYLGQDSLITKGGLAEYMDSFSEYFDYLIKNKDSKKVVINNYLHNFLHRFATENNLYTCGSFVSDMAIGNDGKFYPCQRFAGDKDYIIGDIDTGYDEQAISKIRNDIESFNNSKCQYCFAKNICKGGCFWERKFFEKQGMIHHFCELNRRVILEHLYLLLETKES